MFYGLRPPESGDQEANPQETKQARLRMTDDSLLMDG